MEKEEHRKSARNLTKEKKRVVGWCVGAKKGEWGREAGRGRGGGFVPLRGAEKRRVHTTQGGGNTRRSETVMEEGSPR